MTTTEIENEEKVRLTVPQFVVDYEFKHIPKPFPSVSNYMVFVGASQSGKTRLMISLLTNKKMYKQAFDNIITVIPTHSRRSISDNIFDTISPDKQYNELNLEILINIYEKLQGYANDEMDTLLIIDDFTSELKNPSFLRLFNTLINNRRHLRLTIWTLVQTYNSIPLSNRKIIIFLILFKCKNNSEKISIREEMTQLDKYQFEEVYHYIFDKNFNYMVIDKDNDEIYKKFNKIIIS